MEIDYNTGVSLITATYNRYSELIKLIDSLMIQSNKNFELIIIDQNPDELILPIVERAINAGIVITHIKTTKRGLSIGRNIGIKVAKYNIIGIPDDDCWFEKNTIENLCNYFNAHPEVGAVSALWSEFDQNKNNYEFTYSKSKAFALKQFTNPSSQLFFSKKMFELYGTFDERFGVGQFLGAGEETELILRLLKNDIKVNFSPDIIVHHPYTPSRPPLSKIRKYERSMGALFLKCKISIFVILRGFISPLDKFKKINLLYALVKSIGRFEGMLYWITTARHFPANTVDNHIDIDCSCNEVTINKR